MFSLQGREAARNLGEGARPASAPPAVAGHRVCMCPNSSDYRYNVSRSIRPP